MGSLIFTDAYRTSLPALRRYGSPVAHNVALRPGLEPVRVALETYVRDMPASEAAKVISRLRSTNDEAFVAAEYEVLLYGFFRTRGWQVELNVPLGKGDADLLVSRDDTRAFVEIATLFPSGEEGQRLAVADNLVARLDAIDAPEYQGRLSFTGDPIPIHANLAKVEASLEQALASMRTGAASGRAFDFGWVRVAVEARDEGRRGFVAEVDRPHETDALSNAQNALQRKVQRFRSARTELPVVVALCDAGFIRDFHASIEPILLGEAQSSLSRSDHGGITLTLHRSGQAALFNTRAADPSLSAVVTVDRRLLDGVVCMGMEVWHSPNAANRLPGEVFGPVTQHTAIPAGDHAWDIMPAQQRETVVAVNARETVPES